MLFSSSPSEKLGSFFWKYRKIFLIVLAVLACVFGYYASQVKPDNSLEAITVEDDPTMLLLKRVEKEFGSEEFISIAFETDSFFSAKSLQTIDELSKQVAQIDGIAQVLSLTTIWRLSDDIVDGERQLKITSFIDPSWITTGVPAEMIPKLLDEPLYKKLIYSPDGKTTALLAQLKVLGNDDAKRTAIVTSARQILKNAELKTGIKFHLWGNPVIHRNTFGTVEHEQNTLPIYMLMAVMLLMYFSYRSTFVGLSPLILMGLVLIFVVGALGIAGLNFNWLTSIVPAVIMIVSLCDTMHVINEFLASKAQGEKAVRSIYKSVGLPSLITGITTVFGFLSLAVSPIRPVREFGLFVALGVMLAFIFTFTVFVLILNYGPRTFRTSVPRKTAPSILKLLEFCLFLVLKHPKKIVVVTVLLLVVSIFGIFRLEINTHMLNIFKHDVFQMEASNNFLKKGAGGGVECYLLMESDTPGRFYDPALLRKMDELQSLVASQFFEVQRSISIVDFVKYFNKVLHDNNPAFDRVPDTAEEVAQIFLLMEADKDMTGWQSFVNADYSRTRIRTFALVADDSARTLEIGRIVAQDIKDAIPPDINAQFTGRPFATANMMKYLSESMVKSTATSGLTITLILILLFRSVYIGMICSIPNLVTTIIGIGAMGFLGIPVNLATSMVFSIAMGIADDDMVHMVWHMRDHVRAGASHETALRKTFDEVGVPIVTSTVVLVGGFLMLSLSRVWPTTQMGIVVALCCIIALFATILLAAAMIILMKPFKVNPGVVKELAS